MDILHKRIKQRRLELNMTLVELAKKVGVRDATIQRYESGEIKNIKKATIVKLARALQTTPAYLMGWETPPSDSPDEQALRQLLNDTGPAIIMGHGGTGQKIIEVNDEEYQMLKAMLELTRKQKKS